jgi:hypothetical protein
MTVAKRYTLVHLSIDDPYVERTALGGPMPLIVDCMTAILIV